MRTRWALLALLPLACGGPEGRDPFGGSAANTLGNAGSATDDGIGDDDDDDASGGDDDDDASDDDDDDSVKLDVAADEGDDQAGDEGGGGEGCEKVDFLFVIDGSGSMGDNQDSLIASFPGFISSIQNTLVDAQDYHIMVVDTDASWGGDCAFLCPTFMFCPDIPEYDCSMPSPPSACDATLGAGVNWTMADDAPNVFCDFSTGARYMDSTEPDLTSAFSCAAKVGSDGDSDERPMGAMVGALSVDMGQAGGCNEGFIREDAILVVTIITDEEDDDSNGNPAGWYANVVASKAGDATAMVMLGLINDTDAPMPVCPAESQDPAKIRDFVTMFPNHITGSVCAPNYNDFFQQAVDLIDQTCDDFTPPEG